jgi:hypothetical protein
MPIIILKGKGDWYGRLVLLPLWPLLPKQLLPWNSCQPTGPARNTFSFSVFTRTTLLVYTHVVCVYYLRPSTEFSLLFLHTSFFTTPRLMDGWVHGHDIQTYYYKLFFR